MGTEVQLQRATDLLLACPLVLWEARAHLGSIRVGRGPQRGCGPPAEERCRSQWIQLPKNRIHPVRIFKATSHRSRKKSLDF